MTRTVTTLQHVLDEARTNAQRYTQGLNEGGGGYNPFHQSLAALEAELAEALAQEIHATYAARRASEDAAWTPEVTTARRIAWNTWVKAQGRVISPATLAAHCHDVGHDMETLARQIKRHRL